VTLAFLPYATNLDEQTRGARAAGHELLVHVPMSPTGPADPGPHALSPDLPREEIARRLEWDLSRFGGFVGINNHMGSEFTADPKLAWVMEELKARGLLFLDSRTTSDTRGVALAREYGVPNADRHVFLDNARSAAEVRDRLAEVEALARRDGYAVAIGHPHGETLAALEDWIGGLEARGFALAPISAIAARRASDSPFAAAEPPEAPVQKN